MESTAYVKTTLWTT